MRFIFSFENGSSPRARGTPAFALTHLGPKRFIPARAGNTARWSRAATATSVHPRACGEHVQVLALLNPQPRFIPARAGNTSTHTPQRGCATVHPRACGERQPMGCSINESVGSSPRVRGTRPSKSRCASQVPVHPRACGEHRPRRSTSASVIGSSPRVRGTLPMHGCRWARDRFIPARAGNTSPGELRGPAGAVHPRACGEHADSGEKKWAMHGSSPRVRGTRLMGRGLDSRNRFIPARAGNTRSCRSTTPTVRGSSPRVRGTR